jgi:TolB-like protein/Tfp pilus assembly protein PilF
VLRVVHSDWPEKPDPESNALPNEPGLDGEPLAGSRQRAVFLSYASQDAQAAQRICGALRAAGIEVWFDQSELRGGEVWDSTIRKQIRSCALFIPVISANTHARIEGYFRLEWKLAVDRSHLLAPDQAFLVPVAIDHTPQSDERLPDRFRELHWTRLPDGHTPPAFVERIARLLSPVAQEVVPAGHARGGAAEPASVSAAGRAPRSALSALIWASALVAVVGIVGYYAFQWPAAPRHTAEPVASAPPMLSAAVDAIPQKSIAVLPFVDMSEKRDQEYFSDGLAEELLDLLSQVPDLRVPARTSSFYFKGRTDDVATIAGKLRVAQLLEGSVRRSGNKIRVTAQLIRADSGYHIWSKTYDRDAKDIFQVQDEIANAVVNALKAQLLPAQPLASRHRTDNTEAFAEYLMGNKLRESDTADSNRQALEAYRRAAALDPNYAAAYSGIADAEWRVADMITGEAAGYQRSLEAAEHAIALAPNSADGYWARGGLRMVYYYDWAAAEADFRKALELDPNDVRVLRDYGGLLAGRGRTAEALEVMRKGIALDPLSARAWRQLALLELDLARFAEAKQAAQHLVVILPNSYLTRSVTGRIALAEGRYADALTEFRKDDSSAWKLIGSAMAEHSLGHAAASQAALDELILKRPATLAYQIAEVYAWRGERDQAFAWLERAYRQHDGGIGYVLHDSLLASLHVDPRYTALLKKLNLAS